MARIATEEGPHPVDLHVGRRVAERRISSGHTQTDLAGALGLTFQQVQKYEKGANRISASKLWEAAAFLGVDIDYFFSGLSETSPSDDETRTAYPITRTSLEIDRLSKRLTAKQQRLAMGVHS